MLTITNEDNMVLMSRYTDKYFDLAIVDPPYGISEDGLKNHSRNKLAKATKYTPKNWDKEIPSKEYFTELRRVSKNQIVWGGNYFVQNLTNSSCWLVWDKDNSGDFADCELAWTSFDTAVRKMQWRWNGMLQGDMKNKETRIHPTQKPVALYKWILDKYAKCSECEGSGEVTSNTIDCDVQICKKCKGKTPQILDTHLGSGSIAIACHDYGYDLTSCELDKEYFDKAMERINNHVAQQKLF